MKTLNPIQILDLQDLAKAEISKMIDSLGKMKDWRAKEIKLREITRYENTVRILDDMFNVALMEEDLILDTEKEYA
jgi:hypothetical protein